jgi:myo-inositol-1-phosphate synthase
MAEIRLAIIGAGNCASNLVQGFQYYKGASTSERVPGLMHPVLGGYKITDIKPVVAFDVDSRKVGKDLSEAIFLGTNNTPKIADVPNLGVEVLKGPVLDGIGEMMSQVIPIDSKQKPVDVAKVLKENKVDVLLNFLPVGSEEATRFYAEECLKAGCGMVNAIPSFIASDPEWAKRFEDAGLPIVGDDTKAMFGSTIVHRTLTRLCMERGATVENTYQLNVGGNSVTGDQEILLMRNGKIIKTKIGNFIDQMIELYGEKRSDGKDVVDLSNVPDELRCFTVDEHFRVILARPSALIRHHLDEELYEIETAGGRKVKITKDHNVFVLNDEGELEAIPVHALSTESRIVVPRTLALQQSDVEKISLRPYLKELFAQGIDSEGNIRIHHHPEIKIPVELPVTDEMLQVAGLWLADGSYDRRGSANIEIACGNDPDCMDVLASFLEPYNIRYEIRGDKQVAVRIRSKTLGNIFKLVLGLTGNSYTKRAPSWVFGLSERQIAMFLRGYMSGDGTVTGKQIRYTTASPGLAEDIRTIFLRVGISASVIKEKYKGRNNAFPSKLENILHGVVSSKDDVETFLSSVGFIQGIKTARAGAAAAQLTKGATHVIPKFNTLQKWGMRSKNWPKWPTLRAHVVLSQLEKVKDENDAFKIRKICNGDVHFAKVRSVRRLKAEPQYVYDLSVPGYERFICSNILVHNTDFFNMLERSRLKSKKISKTESVQSQFLKRLPDENVHIGPSDYVPWLKSNKLGFIRLEGKLFGDIPFDIEVRLNVEDKANSSGVIVDSIRCCKLGLDRGIGGSLIGPSAYFCKHPPQQFPDPVARQMTEEFIRGERER